jgi:hypothetical protein
VDGVERPAEDADAFAHDQAKVRGKLPTSTKRRCPYPIPSGMMYP